jgi:hypothetical protein
MHVHTIPSLFQLQPDRFDAPPILKKLAAASRLLAELKGVAGTLPRQSILINSLRRCRRCKSLSVIPIFFFRWKNRASRSATVFVWVRTNALRAYAASFRVKAHRLAGRGAHWPMRRRRVFGLRHPRSRGCAPLRGSQRVALRLEADIPPRTAHDAPGSAASIPACCTARSGCAQSSCALLRADLQVAACRPPACCKARSVPITGLSLYCADYDSAYVATRNKWVANPKQKSKVGNDTKCGQFQDKCGNPQYCGPGVPVASCPAE